MSASHDRAPGAQSNTGMPPDWTYTWPKDWPGSPRRDSGIFSNPGWTCPVCGRGNAPSTSTCPCVPPPPVRVSF